MIKVPDSFISTRGRNLIIFLDLPNTKAIMLFERQNVYFDSLVPHINPAGNLG